MCAKRLRQYDQQAYDTFSKLGFAISADVFYNGEHDSVRQIFKQSERITFGGVFFPALAENDMYVPSFMYFTKVKTPSNVQSFSGDIYALTVFFERHNHDRSNKWKANTSLPAKCHVGITAEGDIRLLKEYRLHYSQVNIGRNRTTRGTLNLRGKQWQYPWWAVASAAEHEKTPDTHITNLFTMAFITYTESVNQLVVRAARGDCTAAFGINLGRAKYFFANRDIDVASDGKRKRIFHSVVSHPRNMADGTTTQVRAHFRGLRNFVWNTYPIHIVLPDNAKALAFDKPGVYTEDIPLKDQSHYLQEEQAADILSDVLSR